MLKELRTMRLGYSNRARESYERLVSGGRDNADASPFATQKDLFMAAACFGARAGKFVEVSSPNRNIPGTVLDESIDFPILIALAYMKSNENLDVLSDAKQIVQIAEGWAEGGITVINEMLQDGSGLPPLRKLVDEVLADSI